MMMVIVADWVIVQRRIYRYRAEEGGLCLYLYGCGEKRPEVVLYNV